MGSGMQRKRKKKRLADQNSDKKTAEESVYQIDIHIFISTYVL